jgi:nucleoside-diphosphate-sugar epimerase
MLKLVKNDEIHRPGSMNVDISLTHYDNLIAALNCCIASGKNGINIYNIADSNPMFLSILSETHTVDVWKETH